MASGGPVNVGVGPQSWGFMPTGPTIPVPLAATTVTCTLAQFVTTARYAPQAAVINIGAAAANSVAFLIFGSNTVTVANTNGVPIVPLTSKRQSQDPTGSRSGGGGYEFLSTGKSPQQYAVVGSAGTTTVFITPGEGRS